MTACCLSVRLVAATGIVSLALGVDAASATTHMFKCIAGGRTIYQQQACPVDAEPASAPAAAAASAVVASTAAHKFKPASRPASGVPATPR